MNEVVLKRHFRAGIEKVFAYVSEPEKVIEWWGPEGVTVPRANLGFNRTGPWHSEMHAPDGTVYKVSGEVTKVDPPNMVGFTWGWHDDADARGHESHVMIELTATETGTDFVLIHRDLADAESAERHNEGWTSSIGRLERVIASLGAVL